MAGRFDAVVIGGGHNGLVTAAYLARAGWKVLVVERRQVLGGCAVTEEIWPGYKVSTAAYLVSLMHEKVVRELELERHGYQVDPKDPPFFTPFPDGRTLLLWQDQARSVAEIAKFSRKDAERYPQYEQRLEELAKVVEHLLLVTPPHLPVRGLRDAIEYFQLAARVNRLAGPLVAELVQIFTQSAAQFLDRWFESDELKSALVTDGVIGANGGPYSPGTAYVLMHHCMGGVGGKRGLWGFVRGGIGAIAKALASAARRYGTEIWTGKKVAKILVREGRATGVVLQGGEEVEAKVVCSSADPKVTFLELVEEKELPSELVEWIRKFRCEGTSLKINLALDRLPEFKAMPGAPGPQHKATVHICPSVTYVERAWDDAKYGRPSRQPLLELTFPTLYDPSLAPPGKHIMGIFLQYAPYKLVEGGWDKIKDEYADHVLKLIEEYAPGFRSRVLARQVLTPVDMERIYGISGGNIFHGEMSLDQMFSMRPVPGWASYRSPIRGLYLCGSGAHPGGGITGVPGHNAAREILRDHRR